MTPEVLHVGDNKVLLHTSESWESVERDPRGLLLMWEPSDGRSKYIVGMDSSEGITGWTRGTKNEVDHKTDNGVVVVFKVDGAKMKIYDPTQKKDVIITQDVQVAEFAAPCDAVEIARIANVIGRLYATQEEDQAELIWESWPGCGILATQELIRLGYGNLWNWETLGNVVEETTHLGWRSSRESQKILWMRARRHLTSKKVVMRSKWLLAEYANAEIDMEKMRARAAYGYHDDRFQAANMAFWAGHKWAYELESTVERVTTTAPNRDYQNFAPTLDDYTSFSDWKADQLAELED